MDKNEIHKTESDGSKMRRKIHDLNRQLAEERRMHGHAAVDRDHWEEMATNLANAVGKFLDRDVGEHSNMNCPVHTAMMYLEEESYCENGIGI